MNPFSTTLLFVVAIASQTGAVKVVVIGAGAAGLAAARTLQVVHISLFRFQLLCRALRGNVS